MPNDFSRRDRLASQVRKEIAILISQEVKDPAIQMITIQDVELSPDLSHARIYYTFVDQGQNADNDQRENIKRGLLRASGFLRGRLSKILKTRRTPELKFIYDDSAEKGNYLDNLISKAIKRDTRL